MQIWKVPNYLLIRVDSVFRVGRAETRTQNQAPTSLNAQIIYLHKFDLPFRQNHAMEVTQYPGTHAHKVLPAVFSQ